MIRIVSESSTAAGIRRIEAVSAAQVENLFNAAVERLEMIRVMFNNAPDLMAAIQRTVEENSGLKKQAEEFARERLMALKEQVRREMKQINGVNVICVRGPMAPEMVKNLAFQLRGEITEHFAFVAGTVEIVARKPLLTVMLSDDMVAAGFNASQLVRNAAKQIQGGGGGQPHFAQAGGKNSDGLAVAVDEILAEITK